MTQQMVLLLAMMLSFAAQAKNFCDGPLDPAQSVSFQEYHAGLVERLSNFWNDRHSIAGTTDLTHNLTNEALNQVDTVEIQFADSTVVRYPSESLVLGAKEFSHVDENGRRVAIDSSSIVSIRGLRFANEARERFEAMPRTSSRTLGEGDHVAFLLDHSTWQNPELSYHLKEFGRFVEGQILRIEQNAGGQTQLLMADEARRLFLIPLSHVAEVRIPHTHGARPLVASEATFNSFGISWGASERVETPPVRGENLLLQLKHSHAKSSALLIHGIPHIGAAVVYVKALDREHLVFEKDSVTLPWLNLKVSTLAFQKLVDGDLPPSPRR